MNKSPYCCRYLISIVLPAIFLYTVVSSNTFADGIKASYSGFSRVIGGITTTEDLHYAGYGNQLSFKQNSLLGLQGKVTINEKFSFTGMGLFRPLEGEEAELEWFYGSYRPTESLLFRFGKMEIPIFAQSDSLHVGYAFPWALAPREVYHETLFEDFIGVDIRYSLNLADYLINIEYYNGGFKGEIETNNQEVDAKVDGLQGLIVETKLERLSLRASYHTGDVNVEIEAFDPIVQSLNLFGFVDSADSLSGSGDSDFYQLGMKYENIDYFVSSEITRVETTQKLFRSTNGLNLTFGYFYNQSTFYSSIGKRTETEIKALSEIPTGLDPNLDILNASYQGIYENWPKDDATSFAIGWRWDFESNLAYKMEVRSIEDESSSNTTFTSKKTNPESSTSLIIFGLEWVF